MEKLVANHRELHGPSFHQDFPAFPPRHPYIHGKGQSVVQFHGLIWS